MANEEGNDNNEETPKAITEEQMKDFVIKAVNGAVSTHLSRTLEKRDAALKESMKSMFSEILSSHSPAPSDKGGDKDGKGDEMKSMQSKYEKQIEELSKAMERERSQREQERGTRLMQEERGALRDALSEFGVPAPLVAQAVAYLHGELKRVTRDDDGNMLFEIPEKGSAGSYTDRVTVREGVERYLKTEEGKHLLPAKNASGSGNKGGDNGDKAPGKNPNVLELIGQMFQSQ